MGERIETIAKVIFFGDPERAIVPILPSEFENRLEDNSDRPGTVRECLDFAEEQGLFKSDANPDGFPPEFVRDRLFGVSRATNPAGWLYKKWNFIAVRILPQPDIPTDRQI
jgi:hypothetical protein